MSINVHLPESVILKPCITVFGVGGAGCNAVNNMIISGLEGAKFVVANTDAQSLDFAKTDKKIQLGETITRGLGAGASPDIGRAAAEEAIENILEYLNGSNMVFITAGMGGGTGTGAAPVIAKAARDRGILTVGVVTKPFHFEGAHRMRLAEMGLNELQNFVDTLIVIPNQNLFRIANEKTTFADAFKMADDVLRDGVRSITDLMIMPGLINLDFADIRAVMGEMGKAMMGSGEAEGENRAIVAAEAAISNPLLDNSSMKGAKGVLINITGGSDMTLFEVDEAANRIREEVDQDANIIFGSAFNEVLEGKIRVSVVATGIIDPNQEIKSKAKAQRSPNFEEQKLSQNLSSQTSSLNLNNTTKSTYNDHENLTSLSKNSDEEDGSVFIAPKPIEPQPQNNLRLRTPIPVQPEINDSDDEEIRLDKPKKTFDLFGRMVSSVGLRSSNQDKNVKESDHTRSQPRIDNDLEIERELVTEDMIDIPAFHRQNK